MDVEARMEAFNARAKERQDQFGYPEPLAQVWSFLEAAWSPTVERVAPPVSTPAPRAMVGRPVVAPVREEPPVVKVEAPVLPREPIKEEVAAPGPPVQAPQEKPRQGSLF